MTRYVKGRRLPAWHYYPRQHWLLNALGALLVVLVALAICLFTWLAVEPGGFSDIAYWWHQLAGTTSTSGGNR